MAAQTDDTKISNKDGIYALAFEGGKFCLDMAKLIFAGVILAGIMEEDINARILYIIGVVIVLFFIVFGLFLIYYSKKRKR